MFKSTLQGSFIAAVLFLLAVFPFKAHAQSVSIDPPGNTNICEGTTLNAIINGIDPPYSYRWSTGETTASITVGPTAVYRVRVKGFVNGRPTVVFSPWVTFFVIQQPSAIITPPGPVSVCPGQSVTLFGSGGQFYSYYSWNNTATTKDITVNTSGLYELTVFNDFPGCYNSATATVQVDVFDPGYSPTITATSPTTVCKAGYVTLTADPGFSSYSWSTGATTQSVSVLMDGSTGGAILDTQTVYLTVGLNSQCSFSNQDGIVLRSIRQIGLLSTYCGNFNLSPTDSIKSQLVLAYAGQSPQYEFEFEETTNPGVTWTTISATRWCNLANLNPGVAPGKFYNVRVRPIVDGVPFCFGRYCQIGIAGTPSNKLFADAGEDGIISNVFPNPTANQFRLVMNGVDSDQDVSVRITDLSGRLVDSFLYDHHAGSVEFGESLQSGVYLLSAQQGDHISVTRIVKSN